MQHLKLRQVEKGGEQVTDTRFADALAEPYQYASRFELMARDLEKNMGRVYGESGQMSIYGKFTRKGNEKVRLAGDGELILDQLNKIRKPNPTESALKKHLSAELSKVYSGSVYTRDLSQSLAEIRMWDRGAQLGRRLDKIKKPTVTQAAFHGRLRDQLRVLEDAQTVKAPDKAFAEYDGWLRADDILASRSKRKRLSSAELERLTKTKSEIEAGFLDQKQLDEYLSFVGDLERRLK